MDKQTTSVTINGLRTDLLFGARYRVRFGKDSRMIWNGELTERAANGDLLFLEHGDAANFTAKRVPERIRVRPSSIDALFGSGEEVSPVEPSAPERQPDEPAAAYLERAEAALGADYNGWVETDAGQAVLEEIRRAESEARKARPRKIVADGIRGILNGESTAASVLGELQTLGEYRGAVEDGRRDLTANAVSTYAKHIARAAIRAHDRPPVPEAARDGSRWIHSDAPSDADPWRSGRVCGPWCDLYEPAGPEPRPEVRRPELIPEEPGWFHRLSPLEQRSADGDR